MKKEATRKKNVKNILLGYFFLSLSGALISFFLPFYLKQEGLSIIEIGGLFTAGIAIGLFIYSIIYSRILKKIKIKTGFVLATIFDFLQSGILFVFPSAGGVLSSKLSSNIGTSSSKISLDISLQHNSSKKNHRKINSYSLIADSLGILVGIVLAIFLIKSLGFKLSFLIFAIVTLPALLFHLKIDDKDRFKTKEKKIPKIPFKLKLVLFAEVMYWFALSSSFALVITFLVVDKFQGSLVWIGILFMALYLSITITTLISKKYLDKKNLFTTSVLGMIILLISAILIILSTNLYVVLSAMILEGIGAGIWVPSKTAIYWGLTKKELIENISGYVYGWRGLLNAFGPLMGGWLVIKFGISAPFYFKAATCITVILIYLSLYKNKK